MTRPLRIEFPGALYHITARGNRRNKIFLTDGDNLTWLAHLGETCERFNFVVHAYCQMPNHFHLLLETVDGELARGMRHLNGQFSQHVNRKHGLVGHLFQGRYKAILCQNDLYKLELARYIVLNPVRARMVAHPVEWPWSSFTATTGLVSSPHWLNSAGILAHFGTCLDLARQGYEQFVLAGINEPSPLALVENQLVLGDEDFRASVIGNEPGGNMFELARVHRRAICPALSDFFLDYQDPHEAMARAYLSLGYTMPEIARYARVSVKTVSRAVSTFKRNPF